MTRIIRERNIVNGANCINRQLMLKWFSPNDHRYIIMIIIIYYRRQSLMLLIKHIQNLNW